MDRDEVLQSLVNVRATLELMAQAAANGWLPGERRPRHWVTSAGDSLDLSGTLADCFTENDIRHVLRWIEFHVDDGPARRKRLAEVLRTLRDDVKRIECGDPRDPFLWARESIDDAAAKAAREMRHVADYVGDLMLLIKSRPDEEAPPFVPNAFQSSILAALEERAMKKQQLADKVAGGDGRRFYRPGGLTELRNAGLVEHKHGLGYYRPDAAPK